MDRRFFLVAFWALFGGLATGVGFGAAGLVGDGLLAPFQRPAVAADVVTTSGAQATASETPTPSSRPQQSSATATVKAAGSTTRTGLTPGGTVVARCSAGRATLTAAPAQRWTLQRVTVGAARHPSVRFVQGQRRVDVSVGCAGSGPVFEVAQHRSAVPGRSRPPAERRDDTNSGSGSSGGSGSDGSDDNSGDGSDDNSGSGSGGSDDSSGSGSDGGSDSGSDDNSGKGGSGDSGKDSGDDKSGRGGSGKGGDDD